MELINATTKKWIDAYITNPKSAVLIQSGGDLKQADEVLLYIKDSLTERTSPLIILEPLDDKRSIGVDEVRNLQKSLSLQANAANNNQKISRVAVIKSAELLTIEAQNALLKLIEELPNRTIIILSSNNSTGLLSTIRSRCATLPIHQIGEEQAINYALKAGVDTAVARKAFMLAEAKSGVFRDYLDDIHAVDETISTAKEFLQASVFDRQIILKSILDKKQDIHEFLRSLELVAKTGMRVSKNIQAKQKWKFILKEILQTQDYINRNVSTKTALLSLSVSI